MDFTILGPSDELVPMVALQEFETARGKLSEGDFFRADKASGDLLASKGLARLATAEDDETYLRRKRDKSLTKRPGVLTKG